MENGVLTIVLSPPTAIGGWSIDWDLAKRFGGSSLSHKCIASGYNGQSGLTITDSGQGIFNVTITSPDTSGLDPGNYVHGSRRTNSGRETDINQGFLTLLPSTVGQ